MLEGNGSRVFFPAPDAFGRIGVLDPKRSSPRNAVSWSARRSDRRLALGACWQVNRGINSTDDCIGPDLIRTDISV